MGDALQRPRVFQASLQILVKSALSVQRVFNLRARRLRKQAA